MNSLATHPSGALSHDLMAPKRVRTRVQGEGSSALFLIGSVAVHLVLLASFAAAPGPALAHQPSATEIEIAVINEAPLLAPVEQPELDSALPLGSLDATVRNVPPQARSATPSDRPAEPTLGPAETAPSAPEVLSVDNPYASADAAVFTSGSAPRAERIQAAAARPPHFGVESGSNDASAARIKELRAWHRSVQAQLRNVAKRAYPRRALKLRQEGTTKITVQIDAAGNVISARIAAKSGVSSLDQAALQGVQSETRVSAPPRGAGTQSLTVPVTFRIL